MKKLFMLSTLILPNFIKIFIYKKFFGWKIGKNVKIGMSIIHSKKVTLGDDCRIGNFTVIKNLQNLQLGEGTVIGNLNHIAGNLKEWASELVVGEHTSITNGHCIDVGGGVYIGDYVILAGMYSQIWAHEYSFASGTFIAKPVKIGSYTYVGSGVLVSPGATIPEKVVVGLGTVIPAKFKYNECEEGDLIVGNPPVIKHKKIPINRFA